MGLPLFSLTLLIVLTAAGLAVWQAGQLAGTPLRARGLRRAVIASLAEPLVTAGLYVVLLVLTRQDPELRRLLNTGVGPALLLLPMLALLALPLLRRQRYPPLESARWELLRTNLIRLSAVMFVLIVGAASVTVLLLGSLIAAGLVVWGVWTAMRVGERLNVLGEDA